MDYRIGLDDTDAAGVVFAPALCQVAHRLLEQALLAAGFDLATLTTPSSKHALPIVAMEAQFKQPLRHGDRCAVRVECIERSIHSCRFRISFTRDGVLAAAVETVHVAIETTNRSKCALPHALCTALDAL